MAKIYRPTLEEFSNFEDFVNNKIEKDKTLQSGIVKVNYPQAIP